ncbi:MAG: hypothetical protein VKJ44_07000 [Synechococcus sp.]|nr:hypothetical protein [Synechococcus sp.]
MTGRIVAAPAAAKARFSAAAITFAQRDGHAAMERTATAEALMAPLQASAADAKGQLDAIGTYLDQFVPALTDSDGESPTVEPMDQEVVDGDKSGADEIGLEPGTSEPDPATSTDEPTAA